MRGVLTRLWIVACVLLGLLLVPLATLGAGAGIWESMRVRSDYEAERLAPDTATVDERRAYRTLTTAERDELSAKITRGMDRSAALARVLFRSQEGTWRDEATPVKPRDTDDDPWASIGAVEVRDQAMPVKPRDAFDDAWDGFAPDAPTGTWLDEYPDDEKPRRARNELEQRRRAYVVLLQRDAALEESSRTFSRYALSLGAGLVALLLSLATAVLLFRLGLWIATGRARLT